MTDEAPQTNGSTPVKQWYVVHTYSGYESAVKKQLLERVAAAGRDDQFGEVLVPAEQVVELVKGKKRTTTRNLFPGYILVDGSGVVRGDYRYQTLADDGDKLVRHIDILASELRYADGSAAVAYEAAHLFLCYP